MNVASEQNTVEALVEEFVERQRAGERPTIPEYVAKYPQWAEQIRELFPALAAMEHFKPSIDTTAGHGATPTQHGGKTESFGDYRIIREIGRGGMGIVYEAEQLSLGRHVALKMLLASQFGGNVHVKRFQREAKAAGRLHHTNIVPVYGVGEHESTHYYIMQYIPGMGLDEVLRELRALHSNRETANHHSTVVSGKQHTNIAKPMASALSECLLSAQYAKPQPEDGESPISEHSEAQADEQLETNSIEQDSKGEIGRAYWQSVAKLGAQAADGLDYAHRHETLHRDIKPSNLLLDQQGTIWITDFGLAKASDSSDNLTHTGDIIGTVRYMAPERFRGQCDGRSDTYSLGLTLYEMLTFRPAFDGDDRNQLIDLVMRGEPVRPRIQNRSVPLDLETIVLKAMACEPDLRYQSAGDMAADLRRFMEDKPILARRASVRERTIKWAKRRPAVAALIAAVFLVTVIGITGIVWQWHEAASARDDAVQLAQQEKEASQRAIHKATLLAVATKNAKVAASEAIRQKNKAQAAAREANAQKAKAEKLKQRADRELQLRKEHLLTAQLMRVDAVYHRDPHKAFALLQDKIACPPDIRDFAWRYYVRHCKPAPLRVFKPAEYIYYLRSVCLSHDSKSLVTGSSCFTQPARKSIGRLEWFDIKTGKTIRKRTAHDGGLTCLELSPDGKMLASTGRDKTIKLWEYKTGKEIATLRGHTAEVSALAFSPDGKSLISGSYDKTVRLWDIATRMTVTTFLGHTGWLHAVCMSPDGSVIASGGRDLSIRIWDVNAGVQRRELRGHESHINALAYNRDGTMLASGSLDQTIKIWRTKTYDERVMLRGHAGQVRSLCFSHDGKTVISGSTHREIKFWEIATGQEIRTLRDHDSMVSCLRLSRDGMTLASASYDKTVKLWSLKKKSINFVMQKRKQRITSVDFSPDGKTIASGCLGYTASLWDAQTRKLRKNLAHPARYVRFSPDGNTLAIWGGYSTITLIDIKTQTVRKLLQGHQGSQRTVCFSPDGKTLASGGTGKDIKMWDVASGQCIETLRGHAHTIESLRFSPDGITLASAANDQTVRLWDAKTGALLQKKMWYTMPNAICYSPDGKYLLVASLHHDVALCDPTNLKVKLKLKGHGALVESICFSPDGKTLATGSRDKTIKLWNMTTLQERATLRGHTDWVHSVRFSPDESMLASASADGTIRMWIAGPAKMLTKR